MLQSSQPSLVCCRSQFFCPTMCQATSARYIIRDLGGIAAHQMGLRRRRSDERRLFWCAFLLGLAAHVDAGKNDGVSTGPGLWLGREDDENLSVVLACPFVRYNYRCGTLTLGNSTEEALEAEEGNTEFGTSFARSDFSRRCGGNEPPLLPPNSRVLFVGNSHVRETAQALVCANSASLVGIMSLDKDCVSENTEKDNTLPLAGYVGACSARDMLDGPCPLTPYPLNTPVVDAQYGGLIWPQSFSDDFAAYSFSNGAIVYTAVNNPLLATTAGGDDATGGRIRGLHQLAAVFGFAPSSLTSVVMNPGNRVDFGQQHFVGMSPLPLPGDDGEERFAVPPCCRTPPLDAAVLSSSTAAVDSGNGDDGGSGDDRGRPGAYDLQYPHLDGVRICEVLQRPELADHFLIDTGAFLGDLGDAGFKGRAVVLSQNWRDAPGGAAASVVGGLRGYGALPFDVGFLDLKFVHGGKACLPPTCALKRGDHECLWFEGGRAAGNSVDAARVVLRMLSGESEDSNGSGGGDSGSDEADETLTRCPSTGTLVGGA
ncbi:unnamed protein product [Phaeothamnion confervicola]